MKPADNGLRRAAAATKRAQQEAAEQVRGGSKVVAMNCGSLAAHSLRFLLHCEQFTLVVEI
jgi:hypothetical protein